MLRINQSVAHKVVFKAYLASDHVTPATGKTIAITISKNGGAFGNPNAGATNATAISNGWYYVDLDSTDTNTTGPLAVRGAEATIDDVGVLYFVGVALATQSSVDTIDDFLDTEIAAIKAKTDNLPADPADASDIAALIDAVPTAAENADAVWDEQVDGTVTARQSIRLANSANAGKLSGAGTTNVLVRDLADTKNRIDATVDASGNRTAVTRDVS